MSLDKYRKQIDDIDMQLITLLERRLAVSREIAAYKKSAALPVRDEEREQKILLTRQAMAEDETNKAAITTIFEAIMASSRSAQELLIGQGLRQEAKCVD